MRALVVVVLLPALMTALLWAKRGVGFGLVDMACGVVWAAFMVFSLARGVQWRRRHLKVSVLAMVLFGFAVSFTAVGYKTTWSIGACALAAGVLVVVSAVVGIVREWQRGGFRRSAAPARGRGTSAV